MSFLVEPLDLEKRVEQLERRLETLLNSAAPTPIEPSQISPTLSLMISSSGDAQNLGVLSQLHTEDVEFLRNNGAFGSLGEDALKAIHMKGRLVTYPPGSCLFQIGEKCEQIYAVKSGVIEIQRPGEDGKLKAAAYLGPGDILGEMGVFSAAVHRSTARVPEEAQVLVLSSQAFSEVMLLVPSLALRMCRALARRLENVVVNLEGIEAHHKQLEGNLRFFDLSTILQSLVTNEDRTGTLSIHSRGGRVVAEISIDRGKLISTRFGVLLGSEAFYQLFQEDWPNHSFSFREQIKEDPEAELDWRHLPGTTLLLEATRLSDECRHLKESTFADRSRVFYCATHELLWTDAPTLSIAREIWSRLEAGPTLGEILESLPRCHYSILSVMAEMLRARLIC